MNTWQQKYVPGTGKSQKHRKLGVRKCTKGIKKNKIKIKNKKNRPPH